MTQRKKGDFEGAIASFNKSIELNPTNYHPFIYRAFVETKQGKFQDAINDLNQTVKLNPKNYVAYNDIGWNEFQLKNYDAAITYASMAIQLNSTNGPAFGTRGWARYGKGDIAGAIEDCTKAISFYKEDSFEYGYDHGMLDFINGNYDKAITAWENVLQKDPTLKLELEPWIERAKAKQAVGK